MLEIVTGFLRGKWPRRLRPWFLVAALVGGLSILASELSRHTPIDTWLLWRYLTYWGVCAVWSLALVSFGHAVLSRVIPRVPLGEHLVYCVAFGLLAFYLGMTIGGFLGLYGTAFFVGWPLVMLAVGAQRAFRPGLALVRRWVCTQRWQTRSIASTVALGYGVLALTAVYVSILIPENVAFDSRWYHLPVAEQYALAGRIVRYPEGWIIGSAPQLASFLYCWAFQAPLSKLFDHIELSAHVEMTVFLWTLASIGPLTRVLAPSAPVRHAWVALFLFPGILLYDSSLCLGADHIAAFWAVPTFLALVRFWRDLRPVWAVLLSCFIGAALSTKFTAVVVAAFPILAVAIRCILRLLATVRARDWRGARYVLALPFLCSAVGLLVTAPYWAKNLAFYGDPLFPLLHSHFRTTPWHSEMDYRVVMQIDQAWAPTRDWDGVVRTLQALYDFSFKPNDWPWMHGEVPIFGSLFTLSLLCVPFIGRRLPRLWGLYLGVHVSVFVWYWMNHQDRYLQALVPWMAGCVAVVVAACWRSGWLARTAASALGGLQVAWGLCVYFVPAHSMLNGEAPIQMVARRAVQAFGNQQAAILDFLPEYQKVGELAGKDGVVLMHELTMSLGMGVRTVQDKSVQQTGILYGNQRSYRSLQDQLLSMGVTHLLWDFQGNEESIADELVFRSFVRHAVRNSVGIRSWTLAELPKEPVLAAPFGDNVVFYACPRINYQPGLYDRAALNVIRLDNRPANEYPRPRIATSDLARLNELTARADFVVFDSDCFGQFAPGGTATWLHMNTTKQQLQLWERRERRRH